MVTRTFTAPGKLVLAGEYGVVFGAPAVVAAVNRRVRVIAEPADRWEFSPTPDSPPQPIDEASDFVKACFAEVAKLGMAVQPHVLVADSSALLGASGKLGLGSSAAVSVALVTALLGLAERSDPELTVQLAMAAHRQAQGGGSGIDVAASTFGGTLLYVSPAEIGVPGTAWPGLRTEPIRVPDGWRLAVAWSGEQAATQGLLDQVRAYFDSQPDRRFAFLKASDLYAKTMARALREADWHECAAVIRLNRNLLAHLGQEAQIPIETPALAELALRAEHLDAAAKLSGAGGGDCAYTIAPAAIALRVEAAWKAAGYECLDLAVDLEGAS